MTNTGAVGEIAWIISIRPTSHSGSVNKRKRAAKNLRQPDEQRHVYGEVPADEDFGSR